MSKVKIDHYRAFGPIKVPVINVIGQIACSSAKTIRLVPILSSMSRKENVTIIHP